LKTHAKKAVPETHIARHRTKGIHPTSSTDLGQTQGKEACVQVHARDGPPRLSKKPKAKLLPSGFYHAQRLLFGPRVRCYRAATILRQVENGMNVNTKHKVMKIKYLSAALPAVLVLCTAVSTGCKSNKHAVAVPRIETQEVSFPKEVEYAREMKVTNPNDPTQIINFALSLSQRGRHLQAAEFLREAADRFVSRDNEFGVACRAAAANEFLQANDIDSFRETVAQLRREMNRFQLAGANDSLATVLSLGDISSGVCKPSSLTPKQLRELYPEPSKPIAKNGEE
jgi:hypothetical protein